MSELYEVVHDLKAALIQRGIYAAGEERDVYVEGYLSELLEFCQEWRSEIEELG